MLWRATSQGASSSTWRMYLFCVLLVPGTTLHTNHLSPQNLKGDGQAKSNQVCDGALASLDESCWGEPETQEAKIIWMYWGGSVEPDYLRLAIKSYRYHNPDYDIRVLNESTRELYLPWKDIQHKFTVKLTPQAEANVLRTFLLAKHGGIWGDVSSFALNPLDEVISYWGGTAGYFVPKLTHENLERTMDNWFMYSKPREETFVKWLAYVKDYLSKPRNPPITWEPVHIEPDSEDPESEWERLARAGRRMNPPVILNKSLLGHISDGGMLASMAKAWNWPYHWHKYLFMQLLHDDARLQAKFDTCCFRVRLSACFWWDSSDSDEMDPDRCVITKFHKSKWETLYEKLRQTGTQPWMEQLVTHE